MCFVHNLSNVTVNHFVNPHALWGFAKRDRIANPFCTVRGKQMQYLQAIDISHYTGDIRVYTQTHVRMHVLYAVWISMLYHE